MAKGELRRSQTTLDWCNRFGDAGRIVLIASPALQAAKGKPRPAVNTALALFSAMMACKTLKTVVPEKRPNGEDFKGFPSQHAAECFAAATSINASQRGLTGAIALGLAGAVSVSRVIGKKHHPLDIAIGALIGAAAAATCRSRKIQPAVQSAKHQ
jgi:membrane-associated phospholipid phosphatase